jgi:hypothetical protein
MEHQKISKLAELTRPQANALRHRFNRDGRLWRSRLMEDYAAGRDAYDPALRQMRNERLPWLQTVKAEDFLLPAPAHYGLLRAEHSEQAALEALGVEVADYDYRRNAFHVRVNAQAHRALVEHMPELSLQQLHAIDENTALPNSFADLDSATLRGASARFTYWINSDANDDRVTASGSAELDFWLQDREKIDKLLATREQATVTADNTVVTESLSL